MIDGDLVIDLWGGHTDLGRGTEWGKDTIVNVWSSTKGATALAAHMLAERGELDCDAPVTRYWPEFGQQGKGEMPVRYLLTHESGLHQMPPQLPATAAYDWSTMVEALAAQRPAWEPGSKHQYEALTFGWLVGEVIRPRQRQDAGQDRCVTRSPARSASTASSLASGGGRAGGHDPARRAPADRTFQPAGRDRLEQPRVPGVRDRSRQRTRQRSLATIYGALARGGELGGVRLLQPESVALAARIQVDGVEQSGTHA